MESYKIRVTASPGKIVEHEILLTCDHAAVRRGQALAAPGNKLEVWRGSDCIFISEDLGMVGPACRSD